MQNHTIKSIQHTLLATCQLFLWSCGSSQSTNASTTVYGHLTLSASTDDDAGTFEFNSLSACSRNADTGRVDITISQGESKPALSIAIKDYSSTPKSYTCKQSSDNQTSATNVGGKFESCMVTASVFSGSNETTMNTYSIYRETTATKLFTYDGSCSIQVTEASPTLTATISCSDMIQTTLDGAARNPIDSKVKANLSGDLSCSFQ